MMTDNHPYATASWLSRLCFLWPWPLLRLGLERPLTDNDLPLVLSEDSSQHNLHHLQRIWNLKKNKQSLRWTLLQDFFTKAWFMQPLMAAAFIAKVVQAICLGFLIQVFEDDDDKNNNNNKEGYYWAMGIVLCGTIILFEFHLFAFLGWRTGMQYRIAFVAAIFEKTLRLSSTHPETLASNGRILNLASNDVERLLYSSILISWLVWAPL